MGIQATDSADDAERKPPPQASPPTPPPISGASLTSEIIVGIMMLLFLAIGLIETFNAVDDEMFVFGVSLFGFALVFIIGLVRGRLGSRKAARKATEGLRHG
jgi:hypothetical protein